MPVRAAGDGVEDLEKVQSTKYKVQIRSALPRGPEGEGLEKWTIAECAWAGQAARGSGGERASGWGSGWGAGRGGLLREGEGDGVGAAGWAVWAVFGQGGWGQGEGG